MNEDFLKRLNQMSEKIAEERLGLANSKNIMGSNGKIASIAKILGKPILSQGYGLQDDWDDDDPLNIPTMGDSYLQEIGYVWDGLNRGIHMEIKIENFKREISVSYKGYSVYKEVVGDLELYTPTHPQAGEWEHHIDKLYKEAKKTRKLLYVEEEEFKKEMKPGLAQKLLEALKLRWGE